MENSPIILNVITCLVAIISIVFSWLTYKRQRTYDNENHLFKYKLDKYNELLDMVNQINSLFRKELETAQEQFKDETIDYKALEVLADELDVVSDSYQDKMLFVCSFLPENIILKLDDYLDHLYGDEFIFCTTETEFKEAEQSLNILDTIAADITELMRKDLGIEILHKRLERRTRE